MRLWSERATLCPLRCGKVLGAWGLLPLEGSKKAVQAQVVVPRPGKADVLLVQGDKMDIVSAQCCGSTARRQCSHCASTTDQGAGLPSYQAQSTSPGRA